MKTHFLLPRERLLEIIAATGRKPNVPGGGELTTSVATHGYTYPHLWIVQVRNLLFRSKHLLLFNGEAYPPYFWSLLLDNE